MKETVRLMRKNFKYITPFASSTIFGHVQNKRNRSGIADVHNDLSTDAVTPLKYLIAKNYRHMYLYIYRLAKYDDRQSSGKK